MSNNNKMFKVTTGQRNGFLVKGCESIITILRIYFANKLLIFNATNIIILCWIKIKILETHIFSCKSIT